jgi:hypothetical protein
MSKMAHNGLRIGDGGAFGKRQPNICTNANRITNAEFTTVSPTIANTMLAAAFFFIVLLL